MSDDIERTLEEAVLTDNEKLVVIEAIKGAESFVAIIKRDDGHWSFHGSTEPTEVAGIIQRYIVRQELSLMADEMEEMEAEDDD